MSACARAFQKWSRLCDATLARASDVRIAPISKQVRSSMSRFLPSPAGTKRALTNKVLREIFDHWNEIEEKTGKTRGQMSTTHLFRSEPGNYARLIASLLPKDVSVETAAGEMDEDQIDDVIARVQERLLDVRAREARSDGWPEARAN